MQNIDKTWQLFILILLSTFYENSLDFNFEKQENYPKTDQITELEVLLNNTKLDLDERGSPMLSGQLKRVRLIRDIYKDLEILIYDESKNLLDEENKENFIKDLNNINKNKTIINISHKKSSLKKCKRILENKNSLINEVYNV